MKNSRVEIYKTLFLRELDKLSKEIQDFQEESNLWVVHGSITNSAGNLSLHLLGNLNTYIGRNLGGTSYVRDRKFEFSGKDVPRHQLLDKIKNTQLIMSTTLDNLSIQDLDSAYPEEVLGYEMSTDYFISHLLSHFSYHLGQINYVRRMLE